MRAATQQVTLERRFEVWYQHPVAEGAIIDRYKIGPNQFIDTQMFLAWLTPTGST